MLVVENAIDCQISLPNTMTPTLLIDLDNTLLGNAMDTFIPAYTQALASWLADYVAPGRMIPQLMHATSLMARNLDPTLTLKEVFDQHFFPALAIDRAEIQPVIDKFYRDEFPRLKSTTSYRPEAVALVEKALAQGIQIAIATNPLFPQTAILQRLEWAGLPVERYPFRIVPGYETFHFAKPNPEYFAELLGQLGWSNGIAIMAGDDAEMDIFPAKEMGLATYLVTENASCTEEEWESRHARGKLLELLDWMEPWAAESYIPGQGSTRQVLANLRAAPAALSSLTHSLSEQDWKRKPSLEEWSLTEIVCHLRDVEAEVNLPRLERVLNSQNPFIAGRNTDSWAKERKYQAQDGPFALESFITHRIELLSKLERIHASDWDRPARHAIFGPIHLHEIMDISVSHDRMHLQTVRQLIP
jgi:FMN phosphatase YigB (HAD superfamily)